MNEINENGCRTGYWEEYTSRGKLHIKGHYVNGLRHGHWINYYLNRTQKNWEGSYKLRRQVGYWQYFHTNGKLRMKEFYL